MTSQTYSRALVTFAFVRQEFDRTGDIIRGLMPLFEPIFAETNGEMFSPKDFTGNVERLYGLKMHPYVAEDWVPRFEEAGLLEPVKTDQFSQTYRCKGASVKPTLTAGIDVELIVAELTEHAGNRLRETGAKLSRELIEEGIIKRLCKPEFFSLLSRPQKTFQKTSTLTLSYKTTEDASVDPEALLDFILADRLLALERDDKAQFEAISDIAGGALVSEVVLALRSPPSRGQMARSIEVYVDSPLLLDLLDLSTRQDHEYATLLMDDLKEMKVSLRTFQHNVDEIRGILDNALGLYGNIRISTGEVAVRLRTDKLAASRCQMIRSNIANHLATIGVHVRALEKVTANTVKFFPEERVRDLTAQIRPFGSIFSREVDAKSIAGISRMILSRQRVSNVFSLPALFLTKNTGLVASALRYIKEGFNYEEAAPPVLSDRQMAGLVWLARGGEAGNVSAKQLLANCTRAIAPRRDVLARVYDFLAEVNESTAKEFEAMMVEDRCSHYVMSYTLGDAALVTRDNAHLIFEEVKSRAIADTLAESDAETQRLLEEQKREADIAFTVQAARHEAQIAVLTTRSMEQEAAIAVKEAKIDTLQSTQFNQKAELTEAQLKILELERGTIIAAMDAAQMVVTRMKLLITAVISFLIAGVSAAGSFLTGVVTDRFWLSLIILLVMIITAALTFTVAWAIPDLIFNSLMKRKAMEKFDHEIKRRGAQSYASRWSVDFSKPLGTPEFLGQNVK